MAREATRFGCTGWKLVITGRYLVDMDGLLGVIEDDWIMMSHLAVTIFRKPKKVSGRPITRKTARKAVKKRRISTGKVA